MFHCSKGTHWQWPPAKEASSEPAGAIDKVTVYSPDGKARFKSWANDIVPVLLRRADGEAKRTDPTYRVITFNGEPPNSPAGHFEATRKRA